MAIQFKNPVVNDLSFDPNEDQTQVDTGVVTPTVDSAAPIETPETPVVAPVTPTTESQVEPEVITPDNSFEFEDAIPGLAQLLSDSELLKHIPDDVNLEEFDSEAFKKTIAFNQATIAKEAFQEGSEATKENIISRLSPLSQKIIAYNLDNPNASDTEIRNLSSDISQGDYLTNLTVEDHGEKIVREYYKEAGWTPDEINTKVDSLLNSDTLGAEAAILKPKLDEVAGKIATRKLEESNAVKEYEDQLQTGLKEKVLSQIKTGKLNGVPLDRETAQFVYSAVMNSEVPVEMGNRTIHMGYAEAMMRQQKYQGNIENVMLSLIVLKDGAKGIEKYYAAQARTKETAEFVKETKFKNSKRKSDKAPVTEGISTGFKFKVK